MWWIIGALVVAQVVQVVCIFSLKCDLESAHRSIGNMIRLLRRTNKDFDA